MLYLNIFTGIVVFAETFDLVATSFGIVNGETGPEP